MIGGFNTNVRYKTRTFHVQTEDSGHANPKIVTLLYEGGVILTSRKSSYEDMVSADNLDSVVRELMESQHRVMVHDLKEGRLDEILGVAAAAKREKRGSGPSEHPAFGEGIVSERPLDELILSGLCAS